jgi:hypothetical protein
MNDIEIIMTLTDGRVLALDKVTGKTFILQEDMVKEIHNLKGQI